MLYTKYTGIMMPIILVSMGLLAVALYFLLRNKSQKIKNIPFIVLGIVFVGLETSKQIFEMCQGGGYNLYSIPLHVCSFFVFFPIFAACLKQEWKITKIFWALSIITAVVVSAAMVIYPEIIIGGASHGVLTGSTYYLNYHSVIHHALVVLFTFLVILLRPWKPNIKESIYGGCIFGGFLLLAWILANVLDTNFSSFLRFGNSFWIQLLVWVTHVVCYLVGTLIIFGISKVYNKNKAKKQNLAKEQNES